MYHIDDSRYTKKSSVLYEGGSRILFGELGIGGGKEHKFSITSMFLFL